MILIVRWYDWMTGPDHGVLQWKRADKTIPTGIQSVKITVHSRQ